MKLIPGTSPFEQKNGLINPDRCVEGVVFNDTADALDFAQSLGVYALRRFEGNAAPLALERDLLDSLKPQVAEAVTLQLQLLERIRESALSDPSGFTFLATDEHAARILEKAAEISAQQKAAAKVRPEHRFSPLAAWNIDNSFGALGSVEELFSDVVIAPFSPDDIGPSKSSSLSLVNSSPLDSKNVYKKPNPLESNNTFDKMPKPLT